MNSVDGRYDSKKAHHKARCRRKNAKYQGMKIVSNDRLKKFVDYHLLDNQSPRAISGRLKNIEKDFPYVSKNSICRYIKSVYGRKIEAHRDKNKRQRRNYGRRKNKLKNRTFIDKRPKVFSNRMRVGHTEADFIVSGRSGKGILLVVVDRKLRISFLEKITDITIDNVHKSFLKIKKRFPELKSITLDNDILFQKHIELEKLLDVKIYFCDPYSSWQKGSIENTNGIIRRYIPKGSNISRYSWQYIRGIENRLNRRMLECLGFLTPEEKLDRYRRNKKRLTAH